MKTITGKPKSFLAGTLILLSLMGCGVRSQVANNKSADTQVNSQTSLPGRSEPSPGSATTGNSQLSDSSRPTPPKPNSPEDEWWYSEHPGWYEKQLRQDCPEAEQDKAALDAVLRAHRGDKKQFKFGEKDPFNRRPESLKGFKSRPNPHGDGVIVSAYRDNERGADYSRRRSVWLVVDGKVYPLNREAAANVGVLFAGPPPKFLARAGLTHSYKRGETMLDQLGFEEYTSVRKFSGRNPFPQCP